MLLFPHAKVNLTLDVLGRRPDGYHELRSVMQTVTLTDELELSPAADLALSVEPAWLGGPDNLVPRAAEALRRRSGYGGGARCVLRKRIPIAAGLGGGSSDAAAALLGLNVLWDLHLPLSTLAEVGAALGSDIPFFLWGGTALVSGRGEYVQPLADQEGWPLVLARPSLAVSTSRVFAALSPSAYTGGEATTALARVLSRPPGEWRLANALQATTCGLYPAVERVLAALTNTGARQVLMSGSGPTCFGLYPTAGHASEAAERLRAAGWESWAVTMASAARSTAILAQA
ncbi:MAG: 4-(cytidine 5'-diphospho)-2-C-methyl-D-erythritol kinase [Chloroflexota bacterium]